jgi:hypothetical protein
MSFLNRIGKAVGQAFNYGTTPGLLNKLYQNRGQIGNFVNRVAQARSPQQIIQQPIQNYSPIPQRQVQPQVQPRRWESGSFQDIANLTASSANLAGVPPQIAVGQLAAEQRDFSNLPGKYGYFSMGANDENPRMNAHNYNSPQQSITSYLEWLRRRPEIWNLRKDPNAMLRAIEAAHYAGDEETYAQRANNSFNSYYDFVQSTPEWRNPFMYE